jgi:hypothetical protein
MWEGRALRDEGSGEDGWLSRRRLLRMSAMGLVVAGAGSSAGCGVSQATHPKAAILQPDPGEFVIAPRPEGVLGVNFNEYPGVMNFSELQDVKATWVRGFFPMPDADKGSPADLPVIQALLTVAGRGYGTVLSLKFPYSHAAIPTLGSAAMTTAQRRLDAVLPAVMNKIDILVIGNEPFIECEPKDRNSDRLNVFYETMAQQAIDYPGKNSKTRLYMGALNHLDLPEWRTAATERWMRFVRNTPSIAGTDIHPHLPAPGASKYYLDYILPRMRSDQSFLATEFSLVLFYKKHLKSLVSPGFASRYSIPSGTRVWQVIKDALNHPFTQREWNDFLAASPWFANNKNFMRDQMERFRATGKLAVANYGLGQDAAMSGKFGPDSTPWLLNSMFCQHTVQSATNGLPGQNTVWTDEFRSLQLS